MPKAATTIRKIPEMVARHLELEKAGAVFDSSLESEKKHASELAAIWAEIVPLEVRIIATPARTPADVAAKRRFIRKPQFVTENRPLETRDLRHVVPLSLQIH